MRVGLVLGQGGGEEVGMPFRWLPGTCGKEYGEFYPDHSAWKRLRHEYKQARGTLSTAATFFSTFEKNKQTKNPKLFWWSLFMQQSREG